MPDGGTRTSPQILSNLHRPLDPVKGADGNSAAKAAQERQDDAGGVTASSAASPTTDDARVVAKIIEHAWAVADLLDDVPDDEERERLREIFDRTLNLTETANAIDRQAAADALLGDVVGLSVKGAGEPSELAPLLRDALAKTVRAQFGRPES